jgi:hypothetical protein
MRGLEHEGAKRLEHENTKGREGAKRLEHENTKSREGAKRLEHENTKSREGAKREDREGLGLRRLRSARESPEQLRLDRWIGRLSCSSGSRCLSALLVSFLWLSF